TFYRFGVFGTSVITAITAQNTVGVRAWEAVGLDLVTGQLDAVAEDLRPHAIKSGMLADELVAGAVADGVRRHRLSPYVLDPVMVATSGDPLVSRDAIRTIRDELVPLATLVTPNLDEASILVDDEVTNEEEMILAARRIVHDLGAKAALVKGGHLVGPDTVDVLYDGSVHMVRHPRIDTTSTHGTGCTLSAAIAANLALGASLEDAVRTSLDYVHRAIA